MAELRLSYSLVVTAFAIVAGVTAVERAAAETIALIGTGNVGAALGRRFAEQGPWCTARVIPAART